MASLEYSFVQTLTAPGAGSSGPLYFPIGLTPVNVGTVSILTAMTLVSTQSIGSVGPLFNYKLYSSATNSGSLLPIRCTPQSAISAGVAVPIVTAPYQFVIKEPYLAIDLNSGAAGTFTVFYSVLQFPNGNLLNSNFEALQGTGVSGNNIIVTQDDPFTPIVKSANVLNLTGSTISFAYTYASSLVSSAVALPPFTDSPYNTPTYVPPLAGTFNFGFNGASSGLNYYFSTLTNLQP